MTEQPNAAASKPSPEIKPSRWFRDGHMVSVVLDDDVLVVRFVCPYTDPGDPHLNWNAKAEWDELPSCRKGYDEYGQPRPDDSPLAYCNFREWGDNMGALDSIDREITRGRLFYPNGQFPVGWRWDAGDEMYLWAPSALIDLVEHPRAD